MKILHSILFAMLLLQKHKSMRNGTLGMDFDSYARITILLNDHETIKSVCKSKLA